MRFRSVENVMAEIDLLHQKYGVNLFIPEDDLFTANRKKVIPLLQELAKRHETIPGFELQFPNALSVNTLFDDVMDGLIDAGMKVTNIAIESGSNFIQREVIHKNVNLKRAKEVVKYFGILNDLDEQEIDERIEKLFEKLSLTEYANKRCSKLSRGNKQKDAQLERLIYFYS